MPTRGIRKVTLAGVFLFDHMDSPCFVCFMYRRAGDPAFHEHMGHRQIRQGPT